MLVLFEQLEFMLKNGECTALAHLTKQAICTTSVPLSSVPSASPSRVPTYNPTANPTATPTATPTAVPSGAPSHAPSELPTLANALSCSEECAVSPDVVGAGDTCVFVTLMDQFGDG